VGWVDIDLPDPSRVLAVIQSLEIQFPLSSLIIAVNGRVVDEEYLLRPGDEVSLIPSMSGGSAGYPHRLKTSSNKAKIKSWLSENVV